MTLLFCQLAVNSRKLVSEADRDAAVKNLKAGAAAKKQCITKAVKARIGKQRYHRSCPS